MECVEFTRLQRDDFGMLGEWLAASHVHRWWHHESDPASVATDFGPAVDGDDPTEMLVVLLDGRPIGLLQWYRMDAYPEYVDELAPLVDVPDDAASIDYFIGEVDAVGRGVGRAMLAAAAEHVWAATPPVSCLIVPVHSDNIASWTALLRAGFRLVAQGELDPDNPADDRRHEILRLDRPAR